MLKGFYIAYVLRYKMVTGIKLIMNRLLNSLNQALQSAGVDLSQASVSVQIDLGNRANRGLSSGTPASKVHIRYLSFVLMVELVGKQGLGSSTCKAPGFFILLVAKRNGK